MSSLTCSRRSSSASSSRIPGNDAAALLQLNSLLSSLSLFTLPSLSLATPLLLLAVIEALDRTRADGVDRTDRAAVERAVLARVGLTEWHTASVVGRLLATEPYPSSRPSSVFSTGTSTFGPRSTASTSRPPRPRSTPRSTLGLVRLSLEREVPVRPKALFRVQRPASAAAVAVERGDVFVASGPDESECGCAASEGGCDQDGEPLPTPRADSRAQSTTGPRASEPISTPYAPPNRPREERPRSYFAPATPPPTSPHRHEPASPRRLARRDPTSPRREPSYATTHPRKPLPKTSGYLSLVSDSEVARFERRRDRSSSSVPHPVPDPTLLEPDGWSWVRLEGEEEREGEESGSAEEEQELVRRRRRVQKVPLVV